MANRMPLDQVDAAVLILGKQSIPVLYAAPVDVDAIGPNDFDNEGTLMLRSPMVRIRFQQSPYTPKESQRTTYDVQPQFLLLCYCENLRSPVDEKSDTLVLLNAVQETFAGARLTLANGHTTGPIALGDVLPMMTDGQVIDGFYSVQMTVPGYAQFAGTNANFGAASE